MRQCGKMLYSWTASDDNTAHCTACRIPKATDTFIICNAYCFSTTTIVAPTPLNVTLCYIASLAPYNLFEESSLTTSGRSAAAAHRLECTSSSKLPLLLSDFKYKVYCNSQLRYTNICSANLSLLRGNKRSIYTYTYIYIYIYIQGVPGGM